MRIDAGAEVRVGAPLSIDLLKFLPGSFTPVNEAVFTCRVSNSDQIKPTRLFCQKALQGGVERGRLVEHNEV